MFFKVRVGFGVGIVLDGFWVGFWVCEYLELDYFWCLIGRFCFFWVFCEFCWGNLL